MKYWRIFIKNYNWGRVIFNFTTAQIKKALSLFEKCLILLNFYPQKEGCISKRDRAFSERDTLISIGAGGFLKILRPQTVLVICNCHDNPYNSDKYHRHDSCIPHQME